MTASSSSFPDQLWMDIPFRVTYASSDPDSPLIPVHIPENWDDMAAQALIDLSSTEKKEVDLRIAALSWLKLFAELCENHGNTIHTLKGTLLKKPLQTLVQLLLHRKAAPTQSLWLGQYDHRPGFIINLARFVDDDGTLCHHEFVETLYILCQLLNTLAKHHAANSTIELPLFSSLSSQNITKDKTSLQKSDTQHSSPAETAFPEKPTPCLQKGIILLTNLDVALARMGIEYDSDEARLRARFLAASLCYVTRQAWYGEASPLILPELSAHHPFLPLETCLDRLLGNFYKPSSFFKIETGVSSPGPVDALLGVEVCGLAPVFSPLTQDGTLAESSLVRLAHKGRSLESAFASLLMGEHILSFPDNAAHYAMHQALSTYLDHMPPRPKNDLAVTITPETLQRGVRYPLPARQSGFTQKASIGGHRLYLRTGEYDDGSLGEISITPAKENSMVKGLLECFGQAVSLGLQYGVPLNEFVKVFAYTRFGHGGTVEGDPNRAFATSLLDYTFRTLAENYLQEDMPDALPPDDTPDDTTPLLPLTLPETSPEANTVKKEKTKPGKKHLRLVG